MNEPEVAIFDSGTRTWRYEAEYPVARTQWTPMYLGAGGSLGASAPTGDEAPDTFRMPDSYAQLIAGKPVLAYATAPLTQPLKLGGPMSLTLFASSSQIDTAWFINVLDVNPEGKANPLSRGMLRARSGRSMWSNPSPVSRSIRSRRAICWSRAGSTNSRSSCGRSSTPSSRVTGCN